MVWMECMIKALLNQLKNKSVDQYLTLAPQSLWYLEVMMMVWVEYVIKVLLDQISRTQYMTMSLSVLMMSTGLPKQPS